MVKCPKTRSVMFKVSDLCASIQGISNRIERIACISHFTNTLARVSVDTGLKNTTDRRVIDTQEEPDKSAVLFEDRYENTPGSWVEKNSSSVTLTVTAYGGVNGATLSVIGTGLSRLEHAGGNSFPSRPIPVPPGCDVTYDIVYEGLEASGGANDIRVNASVTDGMTGASRTDSAAITSIRVELVAEKAAPDAPTCTNRHRYGVGEKVMCRKFPSSVALNWRTNHEMVQFNVDDTFFWCPSWSGSYSIVASVGDAEYPILFPVLEPTVVCRAAQWDGYVSENSLGIAGDIKMYLFYYVEPLTVSFEGLLMQEVPVEEESPHDGYFEQDIPGFPRSHNVYPGGAGLWWPVSTNAYWRRDTVQTPLSFPQPWSEGWISWRIPMGWISPLYTLADTVKPNPVTRQRYEITSEGTVSIIKSNHEIKRSVFNNIWLDGVKIYPREEQNR